MGLRNAVITSVDRDDLPDYGASAFVGVIRQIRRQGGPRRRAGPGFRDRVSASFAEAFGRSARPVAPEAVGVQAARMGV